MARDEHFEKLERMYLAAPCNEYYLPQIKIAKGRAEIELPVRESFFHAAGAVHGSVYFKAMDDAAYFAVASLVRDTFVLTTGFHVFLLRPISSGIICAVGRVVYSSNKFYVAEAVVTDGSNKEISRGQGSFAQSGQPLSSLKGYV